MITPTEDIQEFCLDTDVPLTHHKRKRSWSETRNPPTDIFQDSYLSWTPEHTTIQMPPESISYIEQNYWETCKISMRVFITSICIASAYICFIYSFNSVAKHL